MDFEVLYLGRLECKRDYLIKCDDKNAMIKSPISAVLFKHPVLGNILYDTGNSPFYSTEYSQETLDTYPVAEFISIEDALKKHGLTPDDIDILILSHLHFDHAGGLRYFRGTKAIKNVIVSEAELKNAYYSTLTGSSGAYVKSLFDFEGICFKPVGADTKLADDFELFIQQSHTPGVIGLIVRNLLSGNMVFTSDTIYTKESYDKQLPPGGKINKTDKEFFDNLENIKEIAARNNADLFFGHDYEQVISYL